ncbi:MAG: hypothetical protein JWO90_1993, partial [Solirubrobacterales bacterium]|nr:hypothetical protein [Solirubrobacterales bacterium]
RRAAREEPAAKAPGATPEGADAPVVIPKTGGPVGELLEKILPDVPLPGAPAPGGAPTPPAGTEVLLDYLMGAG